MDGIKRSISCLQRVSAEKFFLMLSVAGWTLIGQTIGKLHWNLYALASSVLLAMIAYSIVAGITKENFEKSEMITAVASYVLVIISCFTFKGPNNWKASIGILIFCELVIFLAISSKKRKDAYFSSREITKEDEEEALNENRGLLTVAVVVFCITKLIGYGFFVGPLGEVIALVLLFVYIARKIQNVNLKNKRYYMAIEMATIIAIYNILLEKIDLIMYIVNIIKEVFIHE